VAKDRTSASRWIHPQDDRGGAFYSANLGRPRRAHSPASLDQLSGLEV